MILSKGKQREGPKGVSNELNLCDDVVVEKEVSSPSYDVNNNVIEDANKVFKEPKQTSPKTYTPPLPFPQRMAKVKLDLQFGMFLEIWRKLYINIPFTDALSQMASYAKFLKEIFSNKRKLEKHEILTLIEV